ncbi:MAG: dihydrofolate reductase family protein [Nitrospira sp.]
MKVKCSVYIAASVDGFIAKPGGDIEWLLRPEYAVATMKGLRYDDFISTVDAIVMGRHSFEKALSFNRWPYESMPVIVLSRKELAVPGYLKDTIRVLAGTPEQIVSRLESEGNSHLYIDGGITIQRFLDAKMIDEITITRIPILLGGGIPLFSSFGSEQPLRLIEAVASDNGFVQERYAV